MRRIRGFGSVLMVVLPLVAAMAVAGLCVRSLWVAETLVWISGPLFGGNVPALSSWEGKLRYVTLVDDWSPRVPKFSIRYRAGPSMLTAIADGLAEFHLLGFGIGRGDPNERGSWGRFGLAIVVPYWAVILALVLPPILRIRRVLRMRRFNEAIGRCQRCGYDLRATPDRCPECGHVPTASAGAAPVAPLPFRYVAALFSATVAVIVGLVFLVIAYHGFEQAAGDNTTRDPPRMVRDAERSAACAVLLIAFAIRYGVVGIRGRREHRAIRALWHPAAQAAI